MRTPAVICTSMSCCQAARLCSKGLWACMTNQPSGGITVLTESSSVTTSTLAAVDCCGSGSSSSFATVVGTEDFGIFLYTRIEHYQRIEARPGIRCLQPPQCTRRFFVLSNGAYRFQARWSIAFGPKRLRLRGSIALAKFHCSVGLRIPRFLFPERHEASRSQLQGSSGYSQTETSSLSPNVSIAQCQQPNFTLFSLQTPGSVTP